MLVKLNLISQFGLAKRNSPKREAEQSKGDCHISLNF